MLSCKEKSPDVRNAVIPEGFIPVDATFSQGDPEPRRRYAPVLQSPLDFLCKKHAWHFLFLLPAVVTYSRLSLLPSDLGEGVMILLDVQIQNIR